jgi:hypothetical protein
MVTQQMPWLLFDVPGNEDLSNAINQFERTLWALREGSVVVPSSQPHIAFTPSKPCVDSLSKLHLSNRRQVGRAKRNG